jgi:hypothetical protein
VRLSLQAAADEPDRRGITNGRRCKSRHVSENSFLLDRELVARHSSRESKFGKTAQP